jgi:hypothetical protein
MNRLPKLPSCTALVVALACGACGDGETQTSTVAIPDEEPLSYTERSAHHPDPPPVTPEPPNAPTERSEANVFGPSGPGPRVTEPVVREAAPAACDYESDGCQRCTTYVACCACLGDEDLCETFCGDLP